MINIILSGPDFGKLSFPFLGNNINFGARFELTGFAGFTLKNPRWDMDPITMDFVLMAGMKDEYLKDSNALLKKCEDLTRAAIPKRKEPIKSVSRLVIGNWFYSDGYITNVTFNFGPPWSDDGKPMKAEVNLEFKPMIWMQDAKTKIWRRIFRKEFTSFQGIK